MKLTLKKSNSHWCPVETDAGTVKFLIDYPDREQQEKLDEMKYDAFGKFTKPSSSEDSGFKIDVYKYLKFKRYFLKCAIKDWEGLELPCVLKDNELENDLWWSLVRDETRANDLYNILSPEVEFDETDKKK